MYKLRVCKSYFDVVEGRQLNVEDIIEVTEERKNELLKNLNEKYGEAYVEIVETVKDETNEFIEDIIEDAKEVKKIIEHFDNLEEQKPVKAKVTSKRKTTKKAKGE